MSNDAMTWAKRQHVGNSGAKFILCALADYADEDGICWPGHDTLAEITEYTLRSIERHIDVLIGGGWISDLGRHDEGAAESGRRNGRRVYRLLAPAEALNPKGLRRNRRPDKLSGRFYESPGADDPTNCRVVGPETSPHVASQSVAAGAVPKAKNDPTICRVEKENDPTISTERPDNFDRTTRQFRQRSIEEPSGTIIDPSAAAAVPDEAAREAAALPDALRVIKEFDDSLASVWGEDRRRAWPGPNDRVAAARWLAAGATVDICRSVFDALHRRRHAQGQQPPRALSYHDDAIADAIRLGKSPLPHASSGPTPAEQANIEERIKRDVQETLAQMRRT